MTAISACGYLAIAAEAAPTKKPFFEVPYSGSSRSHAESGKTNGAEYSYRVQACNASGCGPWSGTKTTVIAVPPAKPSNVYADHVVINPKMETLTVNWKAVSGATKYEIKNIRTGNVIWWDTITSYQVEGGRPPLSLDGYAVRSCNKWACSAWVTASWREVVQKPTVAPSLSAPTGSASGTYKVSWKAVNNTTSYTLQERKNSGSWTQVYKGSGLSKSFKSQADATYGYRVQACNSGGCGPWSGTKTTEVSTPPATPTGLAVSMTGPSYKPVVHVSWKAAARAKRYDLEVTHMGMTPQVQNVGNVTSTSSLELGGGDIRYRVRGCNGVGCSSWSASKSILLPPGNGGPGPLPLKAAPDTETSVTSTAGVATSGDEA